MTELQMLKEILDSASETGLTAFYWWLAYRAAFDFAILAAIALGIRGAWRTFKEAEDLP